MNDELLKQFLKDNLEEPPSSNFNHRVLSGLPVKRNVRRRYTPADEPLLLGMGLAAFFILAAVYLSERLSMTKGLLLVVILLCVIPVFIILLNRITGQKVSRTPPYTT